VIVNVFPQGFTLSSWPILPTFLKVKGHFEIGTQGQVLCPTTLVVDLHYIGIDVQTHIVMIHATLNEYFP